MVSEGFHGGGDSLAHYRIARFSWEHPIWLLDHWGKPFFTLLAAPFAQFGFKAIQFFNLLCGLITAILALAITKHFNWTNRWLAIPIIMFTPIFLQEFFSGLTEVTFVMLLLLSIWLRLKKQHVFSLLLLSFLPLVRTEAVLFLAWFGLIDLVERKSWQVVLLFTGALVYSLIGWIAKGDFLWLINEMPYSGGDHIYGSGSLYHYLNLMPEKIGWPVLATSVIGISLSVLGLFKKDHSSRWLLQYILFPAFMYTIFHSVMWYLGTVSLGLPRILAVVVPLFAIISIYALNRIQQSTQINHSSLLLGICITGLIVWNVYSKIELPVKLGEEEKVLTEVAEYIRSEGLQDHKIHYYSLYNEVTLGLDPHFPEKCQQVIHTRAEPHINVAAGSLVIWDAHFAPNEGQMPLANLTSSEHFKLLEVFEPEVPFITVGKQEYRVYLFLRI